MLGDAEDMSLLRPITLILAISIIGCSPREILNGTVPHSYDEQNEVVIPAFNFSLWDGLLRTYVTYSRYFVLSSRIRERFCVTCLL